MATQIGYKASELGIIPQDWDVVELGSVAEIQRGASPRPIDAPIWFSQSSNVGWLRISDVTKSEKYLYNTTQNLSEEGIKNSRYVAKDNLIMSICATVGKPIINRKDICIHDGFVVFGNPKFDIEFMFYVLQEYESKWVNRGQTGSQMNLNTDLIKNKTVCLPPLPEQTAIATVLSDTDALISSLQTLIAKKKAIKLSAMQNLLSGKILLPEFAQRLDGSPKTTRQTELGLLPEDWKVVELGDVLSLVLNKKVDAPFFTFIGMQDVSEEAKIINQTVLPITQLKSGLTYFEENDVLVAKITPCFENGKGGYAHNLKTQIGFGSTEFHILRANQQADAEFIYYWTISPKFRQQLALDMVGSAGHKRVPFQALLKFKIPLPSKPEQTAIAQLLSDMDAEIEALECRLKKTQALKQGMMQTLLTGKIRLPLE